MPEIHCQEDCNLSLLGGKTITVTGYGSQGHARALDSEESGHNVIAGLYESSRSWKKTEKQGFEVYTAAEASRKADVIMILINDKKQTAMYKEPIAPDLRPGVMLMFAHGLVIHFGQIVPPKDMNITMIAPKASGHTMRSGYQRGRGTPCLAAVYQDAAGRAMDMALAYGQGTGDARAGILETTFRMETEIDLFGGQVMFCNGACTLMRTGFGTLAEAGCAPENAYFECVHEIKLIVNLIYESGFTDMRYSVFNAAEYGDYITGPKTVTDETKRAMKKILPDIQDGSFAKEWLLENQVGCPRFNTMRKNEAEQPLERVGTEPRGFYSWNDMDKLINNQLTHNDA